MTVDVEKYRRFTLNQRLCAPTQPRFLFQYFETVNFGLCLRITRLLYHYFYISIDLGSTMYLSW